MNKIDLVPKLKPETIDRMELLGFFLDRKHMHYYCNEKKLRIHYHINNDYLDIKFIREMTPDPDGYYIDDLYIESCIEISTSEQIFVRPELSSDNDDDMMNEFLDIYFPDGTKIEDIPAITNNLIEDWRRKSKINEIEKAKFEFEAAKKKLVKLGVEV